MGIINFVKHGTHELAIARPDASKQNVMYKHPDKTVPNHAQLTVDADDVALFFRDGAFVGQLGPGRHTLEASSIPFLGMLIDKFTGGDVFQAEVFFVSVREFTSIKFGGQVGKLRDPQSGLLCRLMLHGTFSLKVFDPQKLVIGLVGLGRTDGDQFFDWFKQNVQKTLKDDIAELIVKKKWPLTDVTSGAYTEELEDEAVKGIHKHIDGYGVEVMRFGDFTIAMDPKDEETLDKFFQQASYVNMTGGLQGYQQFAQAQMMMDAGEGMKKGGGNAGNALAGAGIGLGFGMAGQMFGAGQAGQAPQQQQPQANTPPTQMAGSAAANVTCPACHAEVPPGKFCTECGKPLEEPGPKFCTNCGKPLTGKFCAECGTPAPE